MAGDEAEELYLLEAISSVAATALRPRGGKYVPCNCGEEIGKINDALKAQSDREAEMKIPQGDVLVNAHLFIWGMAALGAGAFAAGIACGISVMLFRRRR